MTDIDTNAIKKAKRRKKFVIKRTLKFHDYKKMLIKQWSHTKITTKIEAYNVYIEEINKITRSSNDDKRLQNFGKIISYPNSMQNR